MSDEQEYDGGGGPAKRQRRPSSGLSFAERRALVIENAEISLLAAKIDSHVASCESFRKLLIGAVVATLGIPLAINAFLLKEQYSLNAWRESLTVAMESANRERIADKEVMSSRFAAIVAANVQREQTIHETLRDLRKDVADLRADVYQFQLGKEHDGSEPSSGPPRRTRQ